MKRVLSFKIETKTEANSIEIEDAAEWQIMDKFFFIRSRSTFVPNDGDRVANDKFWIPLEDITKISSSEVILLENKKEKTEFLKAEQVKE